MLRWPQWNKKTDTPDAIYIEQETVELPAEDEESEDEDDWEDDEGEDEDDRESIQEQINEWGEEWSKTPGFEALSEEEKAESEFIVQTFADYMYTYHDCTPEEWDVESMQSCCLSTLPRKISADEVYFRSIAPVLASFFTFLRRTRRLRNASMMADRVRQLSTRIVAASNDPRNWGMAKSLVMGAKSSGVDIANEAEMDAYMARYNEQIVGQPLPTAGFPLPELALIPDALDLEALDHIPYEREGPKVGRNDPCPCGSGKKYKKCCGNS